MKATLAARLTLASLWHRRQSLLLVIFTLMLSVILLLGIQTLRTEVRQSFTSTISGTDLIVGARSGPMNLLLYSVFHLGQPTNNVSWETIESLKEDPGIDWLVPLSMGDSYRGFRVVGTTREFPTHFRYGQERELTFRQGHWFEARFDVVLGAQVADKFDHREGDSIILAHGGGSVSFSRHENTPFIVSGILDPTGTPVDRAVYISLEGLEAMHVGWQSGVAIPGRTPSKDALENMVLTPESVTAALVGIGRPILTFQVQRAINNYADEPLTAILPGVALAELWRLLGQFENTLIAISILVLITSLLGMMSVLLTLQSHRTTEFALLRASGAGPKLIALMQLLECLLIGIAATVLAIVVYTIALVALAPWVQDTAGLVLTLRQPTTEETLILLAVPLAALLTGLLPAVRAWRVSRHQGFGNAV